MSKQQVTVAMLVYKNPAWLDFALEGLNSARTKTKFSTFVVGCDPESSVVGTGKLDYIHQSADPSEYYINRVYRAWNEAVYRSWNPLVVLMNSDMYVSDFWLDELVLTLEENPTSLPCSLLVESGRIPSAMPEYVHNLGVTPKEFDREYWRWHSSSVRVRGKTEPGRLFMPVLLRREQFLDLGGYPPGNPDGKSGDRVLFDKYADAGCKHLTALGSVVYHVQEGEMRD